MNSKGKSIFLVIVSILIISVVACTSKENEVKKLPVEADTEKPIEQSKQKKEGNDNREETNDSEAMSEESTDLLADLLERAPKEPTNLEEILRYPVGPLAGNGIFSKKDKKMDKYTILEKVKDALPSITEDVDEAYLDKWWSAFRYLFAEDYPDPNKILKDMSFEHFGNTGIEDERFHFKDQINVLVILDVSGSMANTIDGKPMMDIAKDSIKGFISDLPVEANVGLRVYGHEGMRTGKTKEQSCESTELVYELQPLDKQEFQKVIDPFEPTGWTPIGLSLKAAKEDFANFPGEENTNLVYVVSDGAETCGGDPVAMAKELADSNIQPIINVIGFNVDIEGQSHLREIADAGGGIYANAGDEEQLQAAFDQAEEIIKQWKDWKDGVEVDARKQKSEQKTEAIFTRNEWFYINHDEDEMLRSNLYLLVDDKYITYDAHDFFKPKMYERNDLYGEVAEKSFAKLQDDIEQNYRELIKKINNAYNEKTSE